MINDTGSILPLQEEFHLFKNSMTNWLMMRSKNYSCSMSFYNIEDLPGCQEVNCASLCTIHFHFKTENLWNNVFKMNSNCNICFYCSILFRWWFELKYKLFHKFWRFRNFHALIKARDAPLNIIRFHSIFSWIFCYHIWNKIRGWEDGI